jgi:ABC-type multidrug transport system ATPase subunit
MLDAMLHNAGQDGRTVLMTTHDLAKGWQVAPRLVFLIDGRIAFEAGADKDKLETVRQTYQERVL